MHRIAVVAFDDMVSFDFTMPFEVFANVGEPGAPPAYRVSACAERDEVRCAGFGLRVGAGLSALKRADTVIVPGTRNPLAPVSPALIRALQAAARRGARIVSICSGAFVLAAAGLLDGLRATTHWRAAPLLAARYPSIDVDPGVLFVDNGQILTSAGAVAGVDLCLHIIRSDHGAAVAAGAARLAVMPPAREGGQAQFIVHEAPQAPGALQALLVWLEQNLDQPLTLECIARRAAMSTRTLSRRFLDQTGTTPMQWLAAARIRRAQQLLETSQLPVERVALASGFGSPTSFRERFLRQLGTSPRAYRRAFAIRTAGGGSL